MNIGWKVLPPLPTHPPAIKRKTTQGGYLKEKALANSIDLDQFKIKKRRKENKIFRAMNEYDIIVFMDECDVEELLHFIACLVYNFTFQ